MKAAILFLLIVISSGRSFGQKHYSQRYSYLDGYSIKGNIGIPYILGELHGITAIPTISSISLEKGITAKFLGMLTVISGVGQTPFNSEYGAYMKNNYWGFAISPVLNLTEFLSPESDQRMKYYVALGIGLLRFHTDVYDKNNYLLRTTSNNTSRHTPVFQQYGPGSGLRGIYYTRELFIPFTFSLDYKLLPRLYLNSSLSINWISTDKFDGTTPYNLKDPYFIEGPNSYSNTANDGWLNLNIGIKYKFIAQRFIHQRGI